MEEDIYKDLKIRIKTSELFREDGKRVLIIDIPSRPVGRFYAFEDVPLMRVGEELLPMSQEKMREILAEVESDFTSDICEGITLEDLDDSAIQKMKEKYAEKHRNELFLQHSNAKILSDLGLFVNNKLTYAALILLGKKSVIEKKIPQARVFHEFRHHEENLQADRKIEFSEPYFILIEQLWETINLRNDEIKIEKEDFYPSIQFFNKKVVREAINNAIAHRNYRSSGEIFIKQYPTKLSFISPGGFPPGVNINNILNVSVSRNRLLSDVLSKTAEVERSGRGIDTIFFYSISEGKGMPDYTKTDDFQVALDISGLIQDKPFAKFISIAQNNKEKPIRLGVDEIILLDKIRQDLDKKEYDDKLIQALLKKGLIEAVGKTRNLKYILSKDYYSFTNQEGVYSSVLPPTEKIINSLITDHLIKFRKAKMADFVDLFNNFSLTREQIKNAVYKLVDKGTIERVGEDFDSFYKLIK